MKEMFKQPIQTCNCEDWPCCVHADEPRSPEYRSVYAYEYRSLDMDDDDDLLDCEGPENMAQSDCERADCPEYSECWEE